MIITCTSSLCLYEHPTKLRQKFQMLHLKFHIGQWDITNIGNAYIAY